MPGQEHGLVAQRYARVCQLAQCLSGCRCQLFRVIIVRVDPQRVMLLQHVDQVVGDPVRQDDRDPGPDADDFDMRYAPELVSIQSRYSSGQHERVSAGEEHVPDPRVVADVFQAFADPLPVRYVIDVADFRFLVQCRQYMAQTLLMRNSTRSGYR